MYTTKALEGYPPTKPAPAGEAPALTEETLQRLAVPFPLDRIQMWGSSRDNRVRHQLVRLSLSAADVRGRLDDVFGVGGYHEDYEVVDAGTALCRLTVGGVTATGAGDGSRLQDALDDAFVRAAARFGVGHQVTEIGACYAATEIRTEFDPEDLAVLKGEALPSARGAIPE